MEVAGSNPASPTIYYVMNEHIKKLIQLQNLDLRIINFEEQRQKLPEEKEKEKIVYEDFKNQVSELGQELKNLKVKQKEEEVDLESKEEQVKKLQLQLYQVRDNRSYSALQNEINSIKADNSIIEEEILKILDEIDKREEELSEKKEGLDETKQHLDKHSSEIDREIEELDKQISGLKKERERFIPDIENSILDKYERILKNKKDSLAIVPIKRGCCQGCFMTLPPQIINEVKMDNKIVICENCSRILYSEE